jgi:hypothetical protein
MKAVGGGSERKSGATVFITFEQARYFWYKQYLIVFLVQTILNCILVVNTLGFSMFVSNTSLINLKQSSAKINVKCYQTKLE